MNVPAEIDPRIARHINTGNWSRRAALTDEVARLIRFEYARCYKSSYRLADEHGVSTATIMQIVQGSTYKKAGGLITWPGEHEPPKGKNRGRCWDVACEKPIAASGWAQRMHMCEDCFRINGGKKGRARTGKERSKDCPACGKRFSFYSTGKGFIPATCSIECGIKHSADTRRKRPDDLSDDKLHELYWGQDLSLRQIAARLGAVVSPDAVRLWLLAANIPLRAKKRHRLTQCAVDGCGQGIHELFNGKVHYGRLCKEHYNDRERRRQAFVQSEQTEERGELLASIVHRLLVGLPDSVRLDAEGEIVLAVLSGTIDINALTKETVKPFITRAFREYADAWKFLSIQAPVTDGEGVQTWGERLGLS